MKHPILLLCAAALPAGAALADETGARLPPLKLPYTSAFADVPTHADVERIDWQASNALVGALQGHAGHWRRPAAAPAKPAEAPAGREGKQR